MTNNELTHWGVKGMKWGVRRYRNKDGSLTPAGRKRYSEETSSDDSHSDYKRAHGRTSTKQMSDKELRERINRLQMEKQYKQLTQREKSIGEKFVSDVLINAAKQTATNYVSKYMNKGLDALIKSASSK